MKRILTALIILAAFLSSCARLHKTQKEDVNSPVNVTQAPATGEVTRDDPPITEKEEKIVAPENEPAIQHHYFVIIGSFKNPDYARKFQEQVASDGFTSVLLRNEEGLYRVSVLSTDDILKARNEIRGIRSRFDKYDDTWLLISVK